MRNQPPIMSKIGIIFLTWRRYLQKDLVPHRITLKQLFVLRQLSRKDYLFPSQIAEMLFCDRPTATVILKNMKREGWITRDRDPENAKQIRIGITESGLLKLRSVDEEIPPEAEDFNPLDCLTAEETRQLDDILSKMNRHMKKLR